MKVFYLKDKNMSRLNALNTAGTILNVMKDLGQLNEKADMVELTIRMAERLFKWNFQDYFGSGVAGIVGDTGIEKEKSNEGDLPF